MDMLQNISTIDKRGIQGTAFPTERAPMVVKSQQPVKVSPAFEAWLQAYSKRLEEACRRADSRPASTANAADNQTRLD